MDKNFLFSLGLLILLSGCGQKSTIKNAITPVSLACQYGDCSLMAQSIVVPLTDKEIKKEYTEYKSNIPDFALLTGLVKGLGDLSMKMGLIGTTNISLIQPLPPIPRGVLKETRIKRLFFYIEPTEEEKKQSRLTTWLLDHRFTRRWVMGHRQVNFNFLEKLLIRVNTHHIDNPKSWMPEVVATENKNDLGLDKLFKKHEDHAYEEVVDSESIRQLVLLKYDGKERDLYLKNKERGTIIIINTKKPLETQKFLMEHPKLQSYQKRILILGTSILVELQNDPVAVEGFNVVISEEKEQLEDKGLIDMIATCTTRTCLDLSVPDVNLIPLIGKDNALKLDAYIKAGEVPESFKLKGFVEFEIKIKPGF